MLTVPVLCCNQVAQVRFANKEFPFHVVNLALGAEIELPIGYFDALGTLLKALSMHCWL